METTFLGKTITRQQVEDALREFARQYADPDAVDNWLQKETYKYAIRFEGYLYPPKYILSLVTGIPTTDFGGGEQTNRVFRVLGFYIVDK